MQLFKTGLFVLFLHIAQCLAQSAAISVTKFDNLPARLFYFSDTSNVIYHDIAEGNVWVSKDEGRKWERADIPHGQALLIIEHPHNNRVAFVLSKGTTHYRTTDRGASWREFKMPVPIAFVGNPLSFHADASREGYVIYLGTSCESFFKCRELSYYTKDNFGDEPQLLVRDTSRCQFAHSTKEFKHGAPLDKIFCVSSPNTQGDADLAPGRLYSSEDFFKTKTIVDFGVGERNARGVLAMGTVSKFASAAVKQPSGELELFVTTDAVTWARARFPHASSAALRENGYTIVEGTTHSLAVDVLLRDDAFIGYLYFSNSNGTYFVESLQNTNRNDQGYVDYENILGVDGIGIANIVDNARDVEGGRSPKILRSVITYDDGGSWTHLRAPSLDHHNKSIGCTPDDTACTLHLYSVSTPHNYGRVFSSPAPGFVMGVGSVGNSLKPYDQCDTFVSTDAGVSWSMVHHGPHKYELGDQGSVLLAVDDEDPTDFVRYSFNGGKDWKEQKLPLTVRARILTTIPDSTSQSFLLIASLNKKDSEGHKRYAAIHIDFAPMRSRKCGESDFERWEARSVKGTECLMGHRQWYRRRKLDATCYVGDTFHEPVEHDEPCTCTDDDYECDYNYVRQDGVCVAVGPEPIPADKCPGQGKDETYLGSSGYRLIPGNTCRKGSGKNKDDPITKSCSEAQKPPGEVAHQIHTFPAPVVQHAYFNGSQTILARLQDSSMWQSSNEGYSWKQLYPEEKFLGFYHNPFWHDRAYLITPSKKLYYTTSTGRSWITIELPAPPNVHNLPLLSFHPQESDWLTWTGAVNCDKGQDCHAAAWYSTNHGRKWEVIEKYVSTCAWARGKELLIDRTIILCESYKRKSGPQEDFNFENNPMEFIVGWNFYRTKQKVFDRVVGFAKFSEYLIVAELPMNERSLNLKVSLDGRVYATGQFPPQMSIENHAYTILESSTDSVFLHLTMSDRDNAEWGNLLKSNSNGTYFSLSLEYVNRNDAGYVDFEKMTGLDGVALINVVSNPQDVVVSRHKRIQTRITHNDGGTWKPLTPPKVDSLGQKYACTDTKCALHIHGFTERTDVRATYSSPSVVGLLMAVGNVGENLAGYTESDTFFSRDAGFTWEEVHKDAHLWEFGDSGSVLVMVNDEEPTDHVLYSLNEGLTWSEYKFSNEKIRVRAIVTVPTDTSRKFILFASQRANNPGMTIAVHLDFSRVSTRQCKLDPGNTANDDFELWSPAEEREERCLFGRQVLYHRRHRDRDCFVGDQPKIAERVVKNCTCIDSDFECEFNHIRDADGKCVLVAGAQPLPSDDSCSGSAEFWYDRTAYRRIPHSTCDGGDRKDRGARHQCPGIAGHSAGFWFFMLFLLAAFTGLFGYWFYRRSGPRGGAIRLPDSRAFHDSGALSTLASVPWFLLGMLELAWMRLSTVRWPGGDRFQNRRGYRTVPVDEDAQVLHFEDEE